MTAVCVYIPPRADTAAVCEKIHTVIARLQTQHSEAFIIITGDFNHAILDYTLAVFYQFVDCPTRSNSTTDLLYANVSDAYRATSLPPLGKSDHNLVYLQPQYTLLVQWQSVTTCSIWRWTPEMEDILRDCYDITDWDMLLSPHGEDIDGMTHCLTDYLNFCVDVVAPARMVWCYLNNSLDNQDEDRSLVRNFFAHTNHLQLNTSEKSMTSSDQERRGGGGLLLVPWAVGGE